jgi:hypothetical protein
LGIRAWRWSGETGGRRWVEAVGERFMGERRERPPGRASGWADWLARIFKRCRHCRLSLLPHRWCAAWTLDPPWAFVLESSSFVLKYFLSNIGCVYFTLKLK